MAHKCLLAVAAIFLVTSFIAVGASTNNNGGMGNGGGGNGGRKGARSASDMLKRFSTGARLVTVDQLTIRADEAFARKASAAGNRRLLSMGSEGKIHRATAPLLLSGHASKDFEALAPSAVSNDSNARKLLLGQGSPAPPHWPAAIVLQGKHAIVKHFQPLFSSTTSKPVHCQQQLQ